MRRALLLGLLLCWPSIAHGGTWTVGPPGSGASFTVVQAAIQVASAGDTIVVLAGSYAPFTVDRPLRILASGAVSVLAPANAGVGQSSAIAVRGVRTGSVVLSGFACGEALGLHFSSSALVEIESCAAPVVLHELAVRTNPASLRLPLLVRRCTQVLVLASRFEEPSGIGGLDPAARLEDATVWLADSVLQGGSMGQVWYSGESGRPGLVISGSVVYVAECAIRGGHGGIVLGGFGGAPTSGAAAIDVSSSKLKVVSGDLRGGNGAYRTGVTAPGGSCVAAIQATVLLSAEVQLLPGHDGLGRIAPTLQGGNFHLVAQTYPRLSVPPVASLGSTTTLALRGRASRPWMLWLAAAPSTPVLVVGVDGAFGLDLATSQPFATVYLDGVGQGTFTVPIPNDPGLRSSFHLVQGIELDLSEPALSNPVAVRVL